MLLKMIFYIKVICPPFCWKSLVGWALAKTASISRIVFSLSLIRLPWRISKSNTRARMRCGLIRKPIPRKERGSGSCVAKNLRGLRQQCGAQAHTTPFAPKDRIWVTVDDRWQGPWEVCHCYACEAAHEENHEENKRVVSTPSYAGIETKDCVGRGKILSLCPTLLGNQGVPVFWVFTKPLWMSRILEYVETCEILPGHELAIREGSRVAGRARAYIPVIETDLDARDRS